MTTTPIPGEPYYGPGMDDATAAMIARNAAAAAAEGSTIVSGTTPFLLSNANEDDLQFANATYDANYIIASANVTWPDGTAGIWTTTSASALGYLVYNVTYLGSPTKTVTCTVTRNANGQATNVSRVVS